MVRRRQRRRGVWSVVRVQDAELDRRVAALERRVEALERAQARPTPSEPQEETDGEGAQTGEGGYPKVASSPDDPELANRLKGRVELLTTAYSPGVTVLPVDAASRSRLGLALGELAITVVDDLGRRTQLPTLRLFLKK